MVGDRANADGDDGYREPDDGYARDDDARYARNRVADDRRMAGRAEDDYRARSAEYREEMAAWRDRVAACDAGVRGACDGYEERYGSYQSGRYAAPMPAYRGAGRYEDDRYEDRRDDRYDDADRDDQGN